MFFEKTIFVEDKNPVNIYYKVYRKTKYPIDTIDLNKPILIWLHGGPGFDHSLHEPFISTLAEDEQLQIILLDLRGQGKSSGHNNPESWNLKQWGQDVFNFCKTLGISNHIVGGISFGGVVAQSYLLQYPTHPAGLILCDTDSYIDKDRVLMTFYERAKASRLTAGDPLNIAELKAERVRYIAEQVYFDPTNQEVLEEHYNNGIPLCGKNKFNTERPMNCILNLNVAKKYFQEEFFQYDFREQLSAKVCCPVLVMYGDQNALHSKISAEETIAAIPAKYLKAAFFKNATTPVYDNEPERASEIIQNFCKECVSK